MKGSHLARTPNRKLKAELGEDPEKYLDRPIDHGDQWPIARIRGIDEIRVVRAWQAIERKLGRGDDGGPRAQIMAWLDDREAFLAAYGERSERAVVRDEPRELPPVRVTINGEPADERDKSAARKLDAMCAGTLATDGGSTDGE